MTKNELLATLNLANNLAKETRKLVDRIKREFPLLEDTIAYSEYMEALLLGNFSEDMKEALVSVISNTEMPEGEKIEVPKLNIVQNYIGEISLSRKVRGGELVVSLGESDFDTFQASIMFKAPDECMRDICLVEQKGGELATLDKKAADNQDLSLYFYDDVNTEDYTISSEIRYSDIAEQLLTDELMSQHKEYDIPYNYISSEELKAMARNFVVGDYKAEKYKSFIKTQLEKIYHERICNAMVEWMANVEKDEAKWVSEEDTTVPRMVDWVYKRVCSEDRTRKEWWKGFGFTETDLEKIAEDYDITWSDVFDSRKQIYLVQRTFSDGEVSATIMNQYELCEYINMSDCHDEAYDIWDVTIPGKARHCHYKGWQPDNLIEVVRDDDNELVVTLFGEDH